MFYLLVISVISILITLYDKLASKYIRRARIPEAVLLAVSAAGGSIAMLIAMVMIRHKTRKYKFMIGIPLIIIIQLIIIYAIKKLGLI